MKKDLLTEMIDELNKLRDEQKTVNIPVPPKPEEIFKVIGRVAKEHEVTSEDMLVAMSMRHPVSGDISVAEINAFEDLKNQE